MCGLFGWNFKKKSRVEIGKRECAASVLAIANSARGDKSWGVYTFSKNGADVRKQVGDISMVPDFSTYGRYPLVMGHTRQPTQGKVTQKNAHPFTVNKITLAHNGVISNSDALDKKYNRSVRVDSQHLAHHMDENRPFDDIEGYGAITWIHAEHPDRLYLCRLRNGSLTAFGIRNGATEDVGVMYSSDENHLRNAMHAARLNYFSYKGLAEGHIHYIENGKLFEAHSDTPKLKLAEPKYTYSNRDNYYVRGMDFMRETERGWWERVEPGKWRWMQKTTMYGMYQNGSVDNRVIPEDYKIKRFPSGHVEITEDKSDGMQFTRYSEDDEDAEQLAIQRYIHGLEGD